jgi:hypothetical protein
MEFFQKNKILLGVAVALVVGVLLYAAFSAKSSGQRKDAGTVKNLDQGPAQGDSFFSVPDDWQYQEAPNPDTTLEAFLKSRELWPDIGEKKSSEEHRERIRREWREFAARYPHNLFIPPEFKNSTQAQKEAVRRDNELAADQAARQAAFAAQAKYRQPGEAPTESVGAPPNAAEQRAWLDYKIRETRSLIEVIDYFLDKGEPDSAQKASAQAELNRLKKKLSEYEKVYAEIPKQ